ncbi:MAG TPA: hypothetical protein VGR78_11445 [Verrucomicrobiae bacterium]|nr:hypothetical protein [Verrucomicrobiae bacterium]
MNARGKFPENNRRMLFWKKDYIGRNNDWGNLWSIRCSFVVTGAGRALLITAQRGAIVMMHRGEYGAHAQIEQANDSRYPAQHHRGSTSLQAEAD